ncbi:MAG: lipid-A-disaccharide synthase, partial [Pseudomonadales bacterium]
MSPLKVAIVAGEASGDILGAGLIKALKAKYPDADFYGIGGDLMIAEGFHSRVSMEQLSVMGLVEVLGRLRSLLKLRRNLIQDLLSDPPDVFIGIDAPDFNLNIELALKRAGIPTVHYVSPSVWAWKRKRIFKIKAAVDLLLTLFPFEAKHYSETSQKLAFVGHPLAAQIAHEKTQPDPRSAFGCGANARVVALLPGSRSSEIKYLAQPFLECAQLLYNDDNNLTFILPAANQHRLSQLLTLCERFPELPIKVVLKQSREAMRAADAILIASGTA